MSHRETPVKAPESAVPAQRVNASPRAPAGPTAKSATGVTAPRSRRALLAGLAGGTAALAAGALRGLPTARAGTDGDVVLGAANAASAPTSISMTWGGTEPAFQASAVNGQQGVVGHSPSSNGVTGTSDTWIGVAGAGVTGVAGTGATTQNGVGVDGESVGAGTGVRGFTETGTGVFGTANSTGTGVKGETGGGGIGVEGNGSGAGNIGVKASGETALTATAYGLSKPAILGWSTASSTALLGHSGSTPPPSAKSETAVYGQADADLGTGVWGKGASTLTSNSVGVAGEGDTGVVGVGTFGALGSAAAAGIGVYGSVSDAPGVPAVFGKTGVIGQADAGGTGVVGFTGLAAPQPTPDTGIYGRSDTGGAAGRGLTGHCATGIGLLGETISGVGVRAYCGNNTGIGLRVTGKAAFDRSGKLTITAGHSSLTKTGIGLTSASFIMATLQTNVAGLFIQAVVTHPSSSSFTVYLNKAPAVSVAVAWLAVN